MAKMNPEIKAKWVEALRSGKYRRGSGRLYRTDTNAYCCLGVLCVIQGAPINIYDGRGYPPEGYNAGLDPVMDYAYLAQMNDTGKTFSEIADYIERTY